MNIKEEKEIFLPVLISPIRKEDLNAIIQIGSARREFQTGTEANQFFSRRTLERWIRLKDGITLVAKINNQVVGFFLGWYMKGPNDGYMNCIALVDQYRNRGIGGQLLEKALQMFEQKGTGKIRCDRVFGVTEEDNVEALNFLEKHGIKKGKRFYYMETMLPRKT